MSNEIEWGYDTSTLDVLDKFHESNFIIFVEGDEDVIFWSSLFDKAGIQNYYIESAGGIDELKKIMSQILNENARVITACDSDYSILLNTLPNHKRIISTYGHSIENTMYCPKIINSVIDKLSHRIQDRVQFISDWIDSFCNVAKVLVIYDIAREKYNKPIVVCGNNCSRFLTSHRSSRLNETIISDYISGIMHYFNNHEIEECKQLFEDCCLDTRYIIKGHFLTNGVINLIKGYTKRILGKAPTIPLTTLYALTCDACKSCNNFCPEFATVEQRISNSVASLRLL